MIRQFLQRPVSEWVFCHNDLLWLLTLSSDSVLLPTGVKQPLEYNMYLRLLTVQRGYETLRAPSEEIYFSAQAVEKHVCSFESPYLDSWYWLNHILRTKYWAKITCKVLLGSLFHSSFTKISLLDMILLFSILDIPYHHRPDLSIQFAHLKPKTNLTSPCSVIWKSTRVLLVLQRKCCHLGLLINLIPFSVGLLSELDLWTY